MEESLQLEEVEPEESRFQELSEEQLEDAEKEVRTFLESVEEYVKNCYFFCNFVRIFFIFISFL